RTAENDATFAERQRLDGLQVHRAGQALADDGGVECFVDGDGIDQLGGILVELHAAAVASAHLFAPVEQRADELFGHAANVDDLRTTVDALRGQAGEARD